MPSSVAHALAAVATGQLLAPHPLPRRHWAWLTGTAVALDLDALGRPFGAGDLAWLGGHRALTHSVLAVVLLAGLLTWTAERRPGQHLARGGLWLGSSVALLTHPALDLLTSYGQGLTLWAPFSWHRVTVAWHPLTGLWPEIVGVWTPALLVLWLRWRRPGSVVAPA